MKPFEDTDASIAFINWIDRILNDIRYLDNEYVLKSSVAELENFYINKVIIEPLVLHADRCHIRGQSGIQIDVSHDPSRAVFSEGQTFAKGTKVDIAIPFAGDDRLWRVRPSKFGISGYPEIEVTDGEILFSVTFLDDSANPERVKSQVDRNIGLLERAINDLKGDVVKHNDSSPNIIRDALQNKRQLAQSAMGVVAGLDIPMKRADTFPTFVVSTKRRARPTGKPEVETGRYSPEPTLNEEEYQHILKVLSSMSLVFERNPVTFSLFNEESIRDCFLLQLNGHYEGRATGETFNASGKTDILIREGDRNVFIAECKFWSGSKKFREAIVQLLGYLTWRDSKCALLVFNRSGNSSAIRSKMHEAMESLPEHRRTISHQHDGDSRYILVKASEPGREIFITTQLYDIPTRE